MSKKLILTSLTAIAFAIPAMAAPKNTSSTFAEDDLMQEDYTYQNQANYTNMGVYDGTVTANAEYEDILYTIAAGQYLPAGSVNNETTCLENHYCPGVQNTVTYDANNNQGIEDCPSGYTSSVAGATASTQCYRACATGANGDVLHSTGALTGGVYYNGTDGDGVNACEPAACVDGYHLGTNGTFIPNGDNPDLNAIIGTTEAVSYSSMGNGIGRVMFSATKVLFYDSKCSSEGVAHPWDGNNYTFEADHFKETLPNTSGDYCYCRYTRYMGYAENPGPWVFMMNMPQTLGDSCTSSLCNSWCGSYLMGGNAKRLAFRTALFGTLGTKLASCDANTITINWTGASTTDINANNAGTAIYGEDIRTPRAAEQITGKTFKGWRFVKPTTPSNP